MNFSKIKYKDLLFDKNHIWHPYTSMINPLYNYPIVSANGFELTLNNGLKLIDGMSSWWSVIHGYNHPVLNQAIKTQVECLSHVMFGGITHLPAINLCKNLINLLDKKLDCVFLSDSGSVAVEVAIKMALQYWNSLRQPRKKFLSIYNGYHGDTFGAISVSDPNNSMHHIYNEYIPKNIFISMKRQFHENWQNEDDKLILSVVEKNKKELAGIILEPIVQGAGGMKFYHTQYLKVIRKICDEYKLLLIVDEIATGFGRTGKLFACNHANIVPDIMCLGKALTGGMLTLAATITKKEIAETISNGSANCFMHGPTFMANPLACAVANASISLIKNENWRSQVSCIFNFFCKRLLNLRDHFRVKDVRILGAIGVIETFQKVNMYNLQSWFVKRGVWIRPFKNLLYLMPSYIISNEALDILVNAIADALDYESNFIK